MRQFLPYLLLLLAINFITTVGAQHDSQITGNSRTGDNGDPFNPVLEPFYHGVASGDPTQNSVILWTRITPEVDQTITVAWEIATDTGFTNLINFGPFVTDATRDYTVKVEANLLQPGTTYYYRFHGLTKTSIVGRTRTASAGSSDQLKFAVVSCNNYQSGYFNAFERVAERNDIDAVIHLGDFIYEYETGGFGFDPEIGRGHQPDHEVLNLGDYRTRYSYYRLEDELRRAMQQHPFIFIWDDHEVSNNAWVDGADNHDTGTEGLYSERKSAAFQAYFEWAPIRDNISNQIYRTFSYGDLMDLIMLDTRHEARVMQVDSVNDPTINNPERTLLGDIQMQWFKDELSNSSATWKVVGNQVLFTPLVLEPFDPFFPGVENAFLDTWDGYPAKRLEVINYIDQNNLDNVFFATGDIHVSAAVDITPTPEDSTTYNPMTGMGSVAVEAVTPSITSNNFDEIFGTVSASLFENIFPGVNPHGKFVDFDQHGYYILDLTTTKAQADYYYVPSVVMPTSTESFACGVFTNSGDNYFHKTTIASAPKPVQEVPAPDPTMMITSINPVAKDIIFINIFPNPILEKSNINFALHSPGQLDISIYSLEGKLISKLWSGHQHTGNFNFEFNIGFLPQGSYVIVFNKDGNHLSRVVIKG